MKRVGYDELTKKEARVIKVIATDKAESIAQIARKAWPGKGWTTKTVGNSHVRNCLRKLTKQGLVKKVGRGLYALNLPRFRKQEEIPADPAK